MRFGIRLKAQFDLFMETNGLDARLSEQPTFTHHSSAENRDNRLPNKDKKRCSTEECFEKHEGRSTPPAGSERQPMLSGATTSSVRRGSKEDEDEKHLVAVSEIDPAVAKLVRCAYALDLCLLGYNSDTGEDLQSPLVDTGCKEVLEKSDRPY